MDILLLAQLIFVYGHTWYSQYSVQNGIGAAFDSIEGYLTEEGCTEKCSLITSDENQNNIPYLSDDVIKPVTSLMSLLSGTVSYHMPSLKSEVSEQGGCFGHFLKDEELSKKRKITKGEHKS